MDRVPDELWTEVCDTVQERGVETSQEKEMQKGKMAVWGDLQTAMKRREGKGKGGKERYTHLNVECRVSENSKER